MEFFVKGETRFARGDMGCLKEIEEEDGKEGLDGEKGD